MRRAMGKKKIDLMASFKIDFVDGALAQNIDKKIATKFLIIGKVSQYGFNKAIQRHMPLWLIKLPVKNPLSGRIYGSQYDICYKQYRCSKTNS